MLKNIVKEITKCLRLELGEEFYIKDTLGQYETLEESKKKVYLFKEKGLYYLNYLGEEVLSEDATILGGILLGKFTVEKKCYRPNYKDEYWCVVISPSDTPIITKATWYDNHLNFLNYKVGNCFKTWDIAHTHAEEFVKELKNYYRKN